MPNFLACVRRPQVNDLAEAPSTPGGARSNVPANGLPSAPATTQARAARAPGARPSGLAPIPENRELHFDQGNGRPKRLKALANKLQGMVMQPRATAYSAGLGASQTSLAYTPFHKTSASAKPKQTNTVRQDESAAPTVPAALKTTAQSAADALPAPGTATALLGTMNQPSAWQEVVRAKFTGTRDELTSLTNSLKAIGDQRGVKDAELVVLAECLASLHPAAASASSALEALHQLDVKLALKAPQTASVPEAETAWKLAAQIQSVDGVGLRLLDKLSGGERSESGAYSAEDASLVRAYFLAAAEVARGSAQPQALHPAALYAGGAIRIAIDAEQSLNGNNSWPGRNGAPTPAGVTLTVAEKALLALRDEADKAITATHGCAFAIHMVRAGLLTDQKRDASGNLSEFHKVESRANKTFGKHIDRSMGTAKETRLKTMLAKLVPQIGKSPFHANDKLLAKDMAGISLAHGNGIHDGRAVKDMVGVVKVALERANASEPASAMAMVPGSRLSMGQELQLRNQCRLAILKVTDAETVMLPRFANATPLSEAQINIALAEVVERLPVNGDRVRDAALATGATTAEAAAAAAEAAWAAATAAATEATAAEQTATEAETAATNARQIAETAAAPAPARQKTMYQRWFGKAPAQQEATQFLQANAPQAARDAAAAAAAARADAGAKAERARSAAEVALVSQARSLLVRDNTGLTPQTLLAWGQAAGGPVNAAQLHAQAQAQAQAPVAEGTPDWGVFEKAYLRSTGKAVPSVATPELKEQTRAEVGSMLANMVRGEELGSGFTLENGGLSHIHTGAVSQILSGLATGGAGSLRLDLGGGQRRVVTFESGVGTDRSFIKVGVSTLKQGQVGLGGSGGGEIGHTHVAKVSASAGADVQRAWEVVHHEGTIFGFPRHLSGGVGGDRALSKEKAKLVELLVSVAGQSANLTGLATPANHEDQGSLVKAAYQAFGHRISVGRFEQSRVDKQTKVSAGASLGVSIGQFGLGVPTGQVAGRRSESQTVYQETSGTLRVQRVSEAITHKASLEGSLGALSGRPTNVAKDNGLVSSTGLAAGNVLSGSVDFHKTGKINTQHRLVYDGEQLPTSFATTTYLRPGEFINDLSKNIDDFAAQKSAKYFPTRHASTPEASVEAEKQAMVDFAAQLMHERDLTATPQLYYEFGDVNEAANLLLAKATLSERSGDLAGAADARQEAAALHEADAGNREGRFLTSINQRQAGVTQGVNGILGVDHSRTNKVTEQSLRFT